MIYRAYINGEWVPAEEAKISVFDSSYLYGEGLFETLQSHRGKVLFFDRHIRRLYGSAPKLHIPIPLSSEELKKTVYQALEINQLREAYIRIQLSAEEENIGVLKRTAQDAHLVILVKPSEPYPDHLYEKGGRLVQIRSVVNDPYPMSVIKSTNYLIKMTARRESVTRGADEGVLLNTKGEITECGGSNLFLVKNGKLLTPPLKSGLLPGITRGVLIELARRLKIPCQEKGLKLSTLYSAEEVFITSSLKGVMPIRLFEKKKFNAPGPITKRMGEAYEALCEKEIAS